MTFNIVSNIIFENDMFWKTLGSNHLTPIDALGKLNCMLSLSSTLRSELLELPPPLEAVAVNSKAAPIEAVAVKQKKINSKAVTKGKRPKAIAKAEELLFKQPLSILHRAVHSMFTHGQHNYQTWYSSSMSVYTAARQFAMPIHEVRMLLRKFAQDETSESHYASRSYGRLTVLTMLSTALSKKGGLLRITAAAESRSKARVLAVEKLIPKTAQVLENWFSPLLAKTKDLVMDTKKKISKKRLIVNYYALEREVKILRMACHQDKEHRLKMSRKHMSSRLTNAKAHARRLDAAYTRIIIRH
jgi:hypothetical protein